MAITSVPSSVDVKTQIEAHELVPHQQRLPCVLLAEDDDELREFLASTLRNRDLEVIQVANGADALSYFDVAFRQAERYATPNLVVSDVRMPHCSGMDLLGYAAIWHVPTILVTAFGSPRLHREARSLGALECFDKPFDIDELVEAVVHHARAAAPQPK